MWSAWEWVFRIIPGFQPFWSRILSSFFPASRSLPPSIRQAPPLRKVDPHPHGAVHVIGALAHPDQFVHANGPLSSGKISPIVARAARRFKPTGDSREFQARASFLFSSERPEGEFNALSAVSFEKPHPRDPARYQASPRPRCPSPPPALRWHSIPRPIRSWWQNRHSSGSKPVPCSRQSPPLRNVQPARAYSCNAKFPSQPRNAGDSTPNRNPRSDLQHHAARVSRLKRPLPPACTLHQPGRAQHALQNAQLHGSDGGN